MGFKLGDWCFFEFELHQIKEIKEGRINEVFDGISSCGGYDLNDRCFPLTLDIKRRSDSVYYWYRKFMDDRHLNHPELTNRLVEMWVDLCNENDKEKLQSHYTKIDQFGHSVINARDDFRIREVDGIKIIR